MFLRPACLSAALVLALVLAPSALAQKPDREPLESQPLEFAAGEVCPFPVLIEAVGGNAAIMSFPSGRDLVTGLEVTRVTNLTSGESVVLRTSGSLVMSPLPDGNLAIVGRGRTLIYFLPQDVGGAGLFLMTGHIREVLDTTTDTIVSVRLDGQRTDVCALLG